MNSLSTKLVVVIFTFVVWWGAGFIMQKSYNLRGARAYSFQSKLKCFWLFGLKPGVDRLYIRYAVIQILAFVYLLGGSYAAMMYSKLIFDKLSGIAFVTFFSYVIALGVMDIIGRSRR